MKVIICFLGCLLSFFIGKSQTQQTLFKSGDRICYIGSSIAMNGACFHYVNLFYTTRYPNLDLRFLNGGISGDATNGILRRLEEDIFSVQPTWCILMLEENDLQPDLYTKERQNEPDIKKRQEDAVQHWMKNADLIVEKLRERGIKIILQTPTIFDEVVISKTPNSPGINANLKRCADHLKELGLRYALPVVDCWTALNNINKEIQQKDSSKTIIGYDRVHVSNMGYFIMFTEFIRTTRADKKIAQSYIEIRKSKKVATENCTLTNLKTNKHSVSFSIQTNALPFPTPEGIYPDSFFHFTDDFNAEIIQVRGLKKGIYQLNIDGYPIDSFNQKELSDGINLSKSHNTPQYIQAQNILTHFLDYWKNERTLRTIKYVQYQHQRDLKGIQSVGQLKIELPAIMEKYKGSDNYQFFTNMFNNYIQNKPNETDLIQQAEAILKRISELNKPVPHTYTLIRKTHRKR